MSAALIDLVSKGAQDAYITGSPQVSLTTFFAQFLFSDLGFSFLWTRVPQLAALALHSSPKVGIIVLGFFSGYNWVQSLFDFVGIWYISHFLQSVRFSLHHYFPFQLRLIPLYQCRLCALGIILESKT